MFQKKKFLLALTIATVIFAAGMASYGLPLLAKRQIKQALAGYGMENVQVAAIDSKNGELMFSGIKLDKEGFSSIESVRAHIHWPGFFSKKQVFSQIIIDNLVLTGEIRKSGRLDIAGWKPVAAFPLSDAENIVLNGSQFDLLTTAGALRLEAKGRLTRQPDSSRRIEAALWGKQHQLTVDTRWDVKSLPDGSLTAVADILEARINLPPLDLSRAQGWLNISSRPQERPSIAGQVSAGQMVLGDKTALDNVSVTINGPFDNYQVILQAGAANYEETSITADLSYDTDKLKHTRIVITGTSSDQVFSFLEDFKNDIGKISSYGEGLTSLLITPGNINRIKNDLKKISYDYLDIVIEGDNYDLTGKIVARQHRGDTVKNFVISMNPGDMPPAN